MGNNAIVMRCRYRDIFEMYKKAVASFWTVEEVDLSQDMRDWDKLSGASLPSVQMCKAKRDVYICTCGSA